MQLGTKKKRLSLDEILMGADPLGLLDVKPLKAPSVAQNVIVERFEAIQSFMDRHQRIPSAGGDFAEKQLARRLTAIVKDVAQHNTLLPYDRHGLLSSQASSQQVISDVSNPVDTVTVSMNPITDDQRDKVENAISLDDIFSSDCFGLLDVSAHQEHSDIFTLNHVKPQVSSKEQPDEIAKREPCKNFSLYQPLFTMLANKVESGKIEVSPYKRAEHKIEKGDVYILYNVMCYIADIGEPLEGYTGFNARTRIIFANGQEAHMLYQSFSAGLKRRKNGKKVYVTPEVIAQGFALPMEKTGCLYILKSLSHDPVIQAYRNLYKIGYTEGDVTTRIKNAEKDKTYLEAPVEVVETYDCININPQKLERFTHSFLSSRRLNINITSSNGQIYKPKEWFDVPFDTINDVVFAISNGTISQYRLDNTTGKLVLKSK
ncbi:GIY-YIG nuclease family protein [Photobacterium iliopiscarium]|uniref:GIY-YIG nuclease family protein n=1 Tax=Photobacterium iliopiscarium TaxID=56192 RepID=UPI002432B1EE|nr:GIY-YIG nuclease family protein [Photobacterium iliopiscarium]